MRQIKSFICLIPFLCYSVPAIASFLLFLFYSSFVILFLPLHHSFFLPSTRSHLFCAYVIVSRPVF